MGRIAKESLQEEIQKLSGDQARVALQEIRGGESLDKAVAIARSYPQEELKQMIHFLREKVREAV